MNASSFLLTTNKAVRTPPFFLQSTSPENHCMNVRIYFYFFEKFLYGHFLSLTVAKCHIKERAAVLIASFLILTSIFSLAFKLPLYFSVINQLLSILFATRIVFDFLIMDFGKLIPAYNFSKKYTVCLHQLLTNSCTIFVRLCSQTVPSGIRPVLTKTPWT